MTNLTYKQLKAQVDNYRCFGYLPATTKLNQKREILEQLVLEGQANRKKQIAKNTVFYKNIILENWSYEIFSWCYFNDHNLDAVSVEYYFVNVLKSLLPDPRGELPKIDWKSIADAISAKATEDDYIGFIEEKYNENEIKIEDDVLKGSVSESVAYIEMNWHEGFQVIPENTRFYSWGDLHTALKEIADANPLKNNGTYTKVKVTLHKKNGETIVHRFDLSLSDFDTNPYESEDVVFDGIPEYEETIKANQQEVIENKSGKSVDILDKECDTNTQETSTNTAEETMANLTYKELKEQVYFYRTFGYLPADTKLNQKREVLEQLVIEGKEKSDAHIAELNQTEATEIQSEVTEIKETKSEADSIDVLETVDNSDKSVSESVDYIVMNWHEGIQVIKEGTRFYSWAGLHTALKEIANVNPLKSDGTYTKVKVTIHKKNGVERDYRFDLGMSDYYDTNPYESEGLVFGILREYEETLKVNQECNISPKVDAEDTVRNPLQENHQNCVAVFKEFNVNPTEGAEIIAKSEITSSDVYNLAENTTQLQNNALDMALYGEWVNKMITSGLNSQIVSYDIWISIRAL